MADHDTFPKGHSVFTTIQVARYKGIVELNLFKVPQILLVGGQNNAGKSSLLEAVFLVMDRVNPDLVSRHFGWRGVAQFPLDPEYWWRPIFNNFDLATPINITLQDSRNKSLEFGIRHEPSYVSYTVPNPPGASPGFRQQSPTTVTQSANAVQALRITASYGGRPIQDAHLAIQPQGYAFQVHRAEGPMFQAIYIASSMRGSSHEDAVRYGQLDLKNMTNAVLDVAKQIEPRIRGLSVVAIGDGAYLHAEVEGFPRKIPVSMMGDGITRILSITLAILSCENGLVLIDELENGLHHSKISTLWSAIARASLSAKCQVIATTHSYECLVAASNTLLAPGNPSFAYARLDRTKGTALTKVVQYSSEELQSALDAEFEVR